MFGVPWSSVGGSQIDYGFQISYAFYCLIESLYEIQRGVFYQPPPSFSKYVIVKVREKVPLYVPVKPQQRTPTDN